MVINNSAHLIVNSDPNLDAAIQGAQEQKIAYLDDGVNPTTIWYFDDNEIAGEKWKLVVSFDSTSSTRLANTSGTNTGDQDISGIATNSSDISSLQTDSHTHINKVTLDKFGENAGGLPTYNGLDIDTTIAQRDVYDGLDSLDNTISLSANNGKVLKDVQDTQQTAINLNTAKVGYTDAASRNAISLISDSSSLNYDNTTGVFTYTDPTGSLGAASHIEIEVRNESGSTIPANSAVYISGVSGNNDLIALAVNTGTNPAMGVTTSSINHNSNGVMIIGGEIRSFNTSAYSENDTLYLSSTAGQLINVRPSAGTQFVQNVGRVVRSDNNGTIIIQGAGRANDIPNLDSLHVFIGDTLAPERRQLTYTDILNTPTDTDDLSEGTTNLYYTEARVSANTDVVANTAKVGITTQQSNDITANNAKVSNVDHPLVETAVPVGAVFTDTVYDDSNVLKDSDVFSPITPGSLLVTQGDLIPYVIAIAANTAKVSNVDHPLVETAVPIGAVFTDTVYDDTAIQAEVDANKVVVYSFAVGDETTDITTGAAKTTIRMPYAMTLTSIRASATTAPVGSRIILDVNLGGTSIFTTNLLSIDDGEKTSTTASTAANITTTALTDDGEITVDIDQIGSTTAGTGIKIYLFGTKA